MSLLSMDEGCHGQTPVSTWRATKREKRFGGVLNHESQISQQTKRSR
jgi:hypothetical protein